MIGKRKRSDSIAKKVVETVFKLRILVKKKTMLAANFLKVDEKCEWTKSI